VEELVARFGLPALVVGAAVEGDVTLVLAGVVAHLGLLPLLPALAACVLGLLVADVAWYWVGRARGAAIRGSALYARVGPVVERLADRVGLAEVVLARGVWGARTASMLFWGVRGIPFARFVAVDLAGAVLWTVVLGALGFAASGSAAALLGEVRRVELWLLAALVAGGAAVCCIRLLARRHLAAAPPPR
jgi:membrane protein DedA with SNARE-associated domain